ncbi:uncharacterized protein Z518_02019 [Rhinocladiella mackenziei CBS 650.93]|uniref:NACHT domain-containing protein n=1 Tax=Rhinocladiella mackenziei CBS 650.93 TaxID=1442369 RepID=A0A0D2IVW4_9EURO|nr:uncharacterized protein Z518_02019 [Rhinocladiella mackenziei CBS 650.93]KIX07366.1 hypothetical protein Z518_02019 [Rhinocladiella mackenziei CBS 650.93]
MTTVLPSNFDEAYEMAKTEFFRELKRPQDYDFSKFTSIDDVYDYTEKLQTEQARHGNMRHLNRIRPYLQNLEQYVGVLDTFSQAKADLLSLIWGPIKLLIQISSTLVKSYDKIIDTMGQIGDRLPHFRKYIEMFKSNDNLKRLLLVFLRDILEFHVTALNFFKSKKWELYFESMWPKYGNKITIIMNNVERHAALISNEVTLASILDAQAAHAEAVKTCERDEEFQRRQDFATVQQSLSPKLYDDELEQFRKLRTPDSGKWIEKNEEFIAWFNASNQSGRVLWIEGIPGAGKSFLSAHVVEIAQLQTNSCTVFAFLSFQDQQLTTARVLQSLVFQVVLENVDLHQVLCREVQSNYRGVSSNTACLQALFIKMLQLSDPTYIIIDGVDEIDEFERSFLLRTLLKVKMECDEVRLLISSRGEDNIMRILRNEATCLRLHTNNLPDIETFVLGKTNDWLGRCAFDGHTCGQIRKLLEPLASNSEGMILYARLMLDNISYLSSLHDIREELGALPRGLDEAYGRILVRITERLPERDRDQVKRILGWVAGSQISIQKRELEVAFSIREGDRMVLRDRRVFLNVLHLCGPIVEIREDTIRFVHFTAKQYLADQQNKSFINLQNAWLDICRTCITYLGFECFEYDADEEIEQAILSGEFVFFHYATTQWITQLRLYLEHITNKTERDAVCEEVQHLVYRRESFSHTATSSVLQKRIQDFHSIQDDWPDLSTTLSNENAFLKYKAPFIGLKTVTIFNSESPLNIFSIYGIFYQTLESMLCSGMNHRPGCHCQTLKDQYGLFLYKCDRIACPRHRHGFADKKNRDQHLLDHDRPFKCPEAGCTFGEIGFKSEGSLAQHMDQHHPTQKLAPMKHPPIQDIDPESLEVVLTEAVKAGEEEFVSRFLGSIPESLSDKLYLTALRSSTSAVVAQFVTSGQSIDKAYVGERDKYPLTAVPLIVAMRAYNLEVVRYLLTHNCSFYAESDFIDHGNEQSLARKSRRVGTVLDHAIDLDDPQRRLEAILILTNHGYDLRKVKRSPFRLTRRRNIESESIIMNILDVMEHALSKDNLNDILKEEARSRCSVEVARWLLQRGAEVNTRGKTLSAATPLYSACVKKTENAAHFAKFLLESGADPNLRTQGRLAVELRGARNISTWLGVTWEELVESTKHARESG